jgi:O-antigen/teichoic acid export membrane protein
MTRRRVARNALFSVLHGVLSAQALLATYALLMRSLTIEEIGLWSLVVGSTMVARLSELGLGAGVLRFVAADLAADRADRAAGSVGMAALAVAGLVSLLALALQPVLAHYLHRLTPAPLHAAVNALSPAALAAVVLASVGNVFTSAIDGAQRMDWRAAIQVGGSLVQLALTALILPRLGLAGLGLVQLGQALFVLVAGVVAAARLIGERPGAYLSFDRGRLRELLRYGGGLQVSAIAQLLFEPLLKVLLSAWSGLALTGYFDMANRIVLQFRSLIVAAYGALVPHVAASAGEGGSDRARVRALYDEAMAAMRFALLPYFAVVAAALPLALVLWKGHFDATFLQVALLQLTAWTVNLIALPAYMLYLGLGRLRWTVLSHVSHAAILLATGPLAGWLAGGPGVLAGGAMALVGGSLIVPAAFRRDYPAGAAAVVSWLPGMILLAGAVAGSIAISMEPALQRLAVFLALPLVAGLVALTLVWRSPLRAAVIAQLRTLHDKA